MKIIRPITLLIALLAFVILTGVATAAFPTYQFSGTFDHGPLAGTAYAGTFAYNTSNDPNLQTGNPRTFSVLSTFHTTQIVAHPTGLRFSTLMDARQVGGFSLHLSILYPPVVSPARSAASADTLCSVLFSSDPFFPVERTTTTR